MLISPLANDGSQGSHSI